jgi:hypothetical protein
MKTSFTRFIVIFLSFVVAQFSGQVYNYTWMKGAPSASLPVYGTMGVASASVSPGSQWGGITWTDQLGNLWLYGGQGVVTNSANAALLNNLWKYSPVTNNWAWMNGSGLGNQAPVHGSLGVSSASNTPGGRTASASWVDASGNLWLFGGRNTSGSYNDLWCYNIANNQWTWMGGSNASGQTAVYGTMSVPATTNIPGASVNFVSWKDPGGNFWLYDPQNGTEVWKYNPSSAQWAWMSGAATGSTYPVYGTMGVSSPTVNPGGRSTQGVSDASGNLYIFGGDVETATIHRGRNDLWKYNISNNQWTWIGGTQSTTHQGTYGVQGVFSSTTVPAGRAGHAMWADNNNNKIWLFGGSYLTLAYYYALNDTWCFDIATGQWAWMKGSNTPFCLTCSPMSTVNLTVYGTQTVPSVSNTPDWCSYPSYWPNDPNTLWIFSGEQYFSSSDLWRFNGCPASTVSISSTNTLLCAGSTATLTASGSSSSYSWSTGAQATTVGVSPSSGTVYSVWNNNGCFGTADFTLSVQSPTITLQNPSGQMCSGHSYTLSAIGANSYSWSTGQTTQTTVVIPAASTVYTLFASGNNCIMTMTYGLNVVQSPMIFISSSSNSICSGQSVSLTASGASSYTWNSGQTGSGIVVTPPGTTSYSLGGTANGCTSSAFYIQVVKPNPIINVTSSPPVICSSDLVVVTASGASTYSWSTGQTTSSFSASPLAATIYTITGTTNGCSSSGTFTQQVLPLPVLNITGPFGAICKGETALLNASGADTYTWNVGGANTTTLQVSPLISTSYTVIGTGANGCGNVTTVMINVSDCVGLNDYSNIDSMNLYPNPAKNVFSIKGAKGKMLKVVNSVGQTVLEQALESDISTIRAELPPGVYNCTVSGVEKVARLIIQD